MKQMKYFYYSLFGSACLFSKLVKAKGEPYEIAYWWISFLVSINLTSLMMFAKYALDFEGEFNKVIFIVIFFLPPFVINYFVFLKRKKYKKLLSEIQTTSAVFILYTLITLMFFIITGYLNIP